MVGRFVEQQDVGTADQNLRQQHAQLEPARQRGQRRAMRGHENTKAHQDFGGARLQGVPVVRGDQVLQVADSSWLGMALIFTCLADSSLFGQRLPHHGIAAHGQVKNDGVVVEKPVLAKHAQARSFGQVEGSMRWLFVAGQEAQKRRLARAVGTHEPVA